MKTRSKQLHILMLSRYPLNFKGIMKTAFSSILLIAITLPSCTPGSQAPAKPASVRTASAPLESSSALGPSSGTPNVVWILLDTCRAENLSSYGNERATSPIIDTLAARGVLFENHYAQSTWTARSVTSYMSGRYFPVPRLNLGGQLQYSRIPPRTERILPEIMKANAWDTYMFTAHTAYVGPKSELGRAFDYSVEAHRSDPSQLSPTFADLNEAIQPVLEGNMSQPFFMYIHAMDTHFPHVLDEPFDGWIDPEYTSEHLDSIADGQLALRKDGQAFSQADKDYFRAQHDGSIAYADEQIGKLLKELDRLGLTENTIFIIGADHGDALGEDGWTIAHAQAGSSDQVLRVPLIIAGPGVPEGKRIDALTENVDIVPTLVDLLGLEHDAQFDGESLVPLMHGEQQAEPDDFVFAWHGGFSYENPTTLTLRTKDYKFDYLPEDGTEHLWRVPDNLSAREDLIAYKPKVAKELKAKLFNERHVLWEKMQQLPFAKVTFGGQYLVDIAEDQSAMVRWANEKDPSLDSDNKWAVSLGRIWSAPWIEDAPAVTLNFPIPNGAYSVSAGLLVNSDYNGHPASSLQVKIEDESIFRTITLAHLAPEDARFQSVFLGNYTVDDEEFSITIDEGDRDHWTAISEIRLVPAGMKSEMLDEGMTQQEIEDRQRELEDLGYTGDE